MTPERWSLIEDLFLQAVEIPAAERPNFLDGVCNGDDNLRRELDSLLACDDQKAQLVSTPFLTETPEDSAIEGRRIGPYRVVRLLGRGGMGAVYLAARDDDQFKKEVAIKLLKRGMDTDSMLARFRQERQILANLEHPFIARLLDGGATDDGLPYFVMEYVDGLPITKYCAEKCLDIDARLHVFRMVCEAVQYAHQSLVVHCDLKPGNILITKEGIPKLLDFGIAKVMSPTQGEMQTVTQRELRLMTPDYASPEQVLGKPSSTSMDIYALGVVLYEILARQRPHRFQSASLAEIEQTICQLEPQRPSAAVLEGDRPERSVQQESKDLAGDLDNIVLTAMHKDPQRRYPSAAEFSEDIRRHLAGLPVMAQEDRWNYRAGKFVRRHRMGVLAASLVIASLVGGMVATAYQARRAERRFQMVRLIANSVIFDLYDQVRRLPGSTGVQMSMIQTVVKYLDTLAEEAGGDPNLDFEIATAYHRVARVEGLPSQPNLGQTRVAQDHFRKALAIFERLATLPETRERAIPALVGTRLEASQVAAALGSPAEAQAHLEKAAAITDASSSRGPEIPLSTLVSLYSSLASAASQRGDVTAEQDYGHRVVELAEKLATKNRSSSVLDALRTGYLNLADAYSHAGDFLSARDNFEKALHASEELAQKPDAGYTQRFALASIHHLYGDILGAPDDPNLGDPAGALAHYRASAAINEMLSAADPKDVNSRRNLSGSYRRVGLVQLQTNPAESLKFYRKAAALSGEISAADETNIQYRSALADALLGQGTALHRLGKNQEALPILRRTIELQKSIEKVDPDRIWFLRTTSRAYLVMGETFLDQGDAARALDFYREGLATAERTLQRAPTSLYHTVDRADLFEAMGRYYLSLAAKSPRASRRKLTEEARLWFEKSLSIWKDWTKQKVAVSYAGRRERMASDALASMGHP